MAATCSAVTHRGWAQTAKSRQHQLRHPPKVASQAMCSHKSDPKAHASSSLPPATLRVQRRDRPDASGFRQQETHRSRPRELPATVLGCEMRTLCNAHNCSRDALDEGKRSVEANLKCSQVTVVHTQSRPRLPRRASSTRSNSGRGVHLDPERQGKGVGASGKALHLFCGESGA